MISCIPIQGVSRVYGINSATISSYYIIKSFISTWARKCIFFEFLSPVYDTQSFILPWVIKYTIYERFISVLDTCVGTSWSYLKPFFLYLNLY
jgi:hypothetical protein